MSRLGTCKHTFKIQELRTDGAAASGRPDDYLCSWLSRFATLPPPVKRRAGGMTLMDGDCDACPLYQAPEVSIPGVRTNQEQYTPIPAKETDQ